MSEYKNIGSFSKVRRGASPRPIGDPSYFGGNVGWVRISDVTQRNNKFLRNTQQYLSPLGESKSLRVDSGDLIMSICATVGKPMIVDIPACIHDGFVQIYDLKNADTEYLYYLLQFHEKDFEKRGQPGTQVNLNTTIVENEIVFMPDDIKKQQKIAKVLTTIDQLIEKTQELIDKHTAIKQGMMNDLFTRGIDLITGQLRPTIEQAPHLYKETDLGWIPKEWEVVPFSEVSDIIDPQPDHRTPPEAENGIPYIGVSDFLEDGSLDMKGSKKVIPEAYAKQKKRFQVTEGDIIFGKIGTIGEPKYIPLKEGFALSANVVLIKPKIEPEYILSYLDSCNFNMQVKLATNTTSQPALGIEKIRNLKILKPTKDEVSSLVCIFNKLRKEYQSQSKYLTKLKNKKIGLMQDLLTGKVLV